MAAQRPASMLVALVLASGLAAQAQDLVGCRLVGASLQCIPGVTESAQQQINTFRDQISADLELEGAIQQQINGLQALVIAGEAIEGELLQATIEANDQAALGTPQYHWYRRSPGTTMWLLIESAQGTDYVPSPVDVGQNLMVVAVVKQDGQVKRVASAPVGPVLTP